MNRKWFSIVVGLLLAVTAFGVERRLAWNLPTNNTDGTVLDDLAGVRVGIGSASRVYSTTNTFGAVTTGTVSVVGGSVAWEGNYIVSAAPLTWTVAWPAITSLPGPTQYISALCYNTYGAESDWCDELTTSTPAPVATNYSVRWGLTASALSSTVNLGPNPVWSAVRASYGRTTLYAECVARLSDGTVVTNGSVVTLNNRKPSSPKSLILVP